MTEHKNRPRTRRGQRTRPWRQGEALWQVRMKANYLLHALGWSVGQIAKRVKLPERAVRTLLTTRGEWLARQGEGPP